MRACVSCVMIDIDAKVRVVESSWGVGSKGGGGGRGWTPFHITVHKINRGETQIPVVSSFMVMR